MHFPPFAEQMEIIRQGVSEIIPEIELEKKLRTSIEKKVPLRVKLGCDPSRPDLHIGHAVVLRKLRQFQDCGHQAILIVGDFTGMIGDPSGKSKTRPSLTLEETRKNGQSYFEQASKILIKEKTEIVYNSDWLARMNFEEVIRLASKYTVARILERDDFEKRYRGGEAISIHEFLYPLAQAMDSVAIKSDVELGGTDQKFNLLVGREIQREYGMQPQVILTMPILEGTDGVEKMSKSLHNYIGLTDTPNEIYGRVLSIPDALIEKYFTLATDVSHERLVQLRDDLKRSDYNPRDAKRELARTIVRMYHNPEASLEAEAAFDRIFINKNIPEVIEEYVVAPQAHIQVIDILVDAKLTTSKGEARRMIQQGGVSIDGEKISDALASMPEKTESILKVGKRKFLKILRK